MKLQTARGMRDIYPEEQAKREAIIELLKKTFKKYGFVPLDTPIIERYDILSAKFAAGEESDAMKETYTLEDNGGRKLGLRFDLTVPLARFIGMNLELKMPFKRYQIGKVYRDAPVKEGRYREFTQCDADIIGSESLMADATCVLLAKDFYKSIGIKAEIRINNRKLLQEIIQKSGVKKELVETAMITLDKMDKFGEEAVQQELKEKNTGLDLKKLLTIIGKAYKLSDKEKINELIKKLQEYLGEESEGLKEIKELIKYFKEDEQIVFDPLLARGLSYYTGSVFEVYATENKKIGSIGGGGRYDKLISNYLEQKEKKYPAVGISFGLDRIMDVINKLGIKIKYELGAIVFIIPIGDYYEKAFEIANELRKQGIPTDIDLMNRSITKNIKYASNNKIKYALFIGENEIKNQKYKIRNLETGDEEEKNIEEIIKVLKEE